MPYRIVLSLLFFFFCQEYVVDARPSNYKVDVRYWGTEEGLSHREVNYIFQDRQGLIWIGTKIGLSRFDGKHFKTYTTTSANLTTDNIVRISQDADGLLWLFSYKEYSLYGVDLPAISIDIFDPLDGTAVPFTTKFGKLPVSKTRITSCIQGANNILLLGAENPAAMMVYSGKGKFDTYPLSKYQDYYPALLATDNTVWGVADHNNIVQMDMSGKLMFEYNTGEDTVLHHDFTFEKGGYILVDAHQNDKLLERYYRIKGNKVEVSRKKLLDEMQLPSSFNNFIFQPGKDLAVGFTYNVDNYSSPHFFNTVTGVEYPLPEKFSYNPENEHQAYLFDREGAFWLGTQFGLYRFEIKRDRFQRFLFYEKEKPFNTSIRGLLTRGDYLYANIERHGLMQINIKTGDSKFIFKKNADGRLRWSLMLYKDQEENIWSYNSDNISKISPDGEVEEILIKRRFIWSGYKDDDGILYLGSNFSLMYLAPGDKAINNYTRVNSFKELTNTQVSFIQKDKQGVIWLCTATGLYSLDPLKGVTGRYSKEGKGKYYLPASAFWHMHVDKEGSYWLATCGDGMIKWDRQTGAYKKYTKNEGFSDNNIYAVYEDKAGHLWMSSDFGIMQFNKKTEQVNVYLPKDGTSSVEYNAISHYQDNDGHIYFGSLNGITAFDPTDFYKADHANEFPVVVTSFTQFEMKGEKLVDKTKELYINNKIELYPGNYYFELEFAVLDYDHNDKISYAWKLEGLDKDWHYQTENNLKIASIPHGKYTLHIKARGSNGLWSKNEINIPIQVYPPFYLRWWFILLLIGGFILCVRYYLKWRTRQLRKREQDLQSEVQKQTATIRSQADDLRKIDEAKNRLFANVSHELRTPLTLIIGPIETAIKQKGGISSDHYKLLHTAHQNSKQLLQLVNEILELSKFDAGKAELNEQRLNLYNTLDRIMSLFIINAERLNIKASFQYHVSTDMVIVIDVAKFEKVINNLLSNALKFTPPGGSIDLKVDENDDHITIMVEDSGRGIHPDDMPHVFDRYFQTNQKNAAIEGGTGIGLALCKELINLMGGSIAAQSELNKGSIFYLKIPVKKAGHVDASLQETMGLIVPKESMIEYVKAENEKLNDKTILIVEDNHSLRDYLNYLLSPGYNILLAENGKIALEVLDTVFQNGDPVSEILILSDVMMPVMDGMELLDTVKAHPLYNHIPFILLTAKAGIEDKIQALRIGVDDYMLKPFVEDELKARIINLFNNAVSRKVFIREESKIQPDNIVETGLNIGAAEETTDEDKIIKEQPSESQKLWLAELESIVLGKVGDSILTVEWLSGTMALSRRQLLRRIKLLTGLTPQEYILEIRLTKARAFLENQSHSTVKSVAIEVGFSDTSYFSSQFKKRFGKNPSEYLDYSDKY